MGNTFMKESVENIVGIFSRNIHTRMQEIEGSAAQRSLWKQVKCKVSMVWDADVQKILFAFK